MKSAQNRASLLTPTVLVVAMLISITGTASELQIEFANDVPKKITLPTGASITYTHNPDTGVLVQKKFTQFDRTGVSGTYLASEAEAEDVTDLFHYAAFSEAFTPPLHLTHTLGRELREYFDDGGVLKPFEFDLDLRQSELVSLQMLIVYRSIWMMLYAQMIKEGYLPETSPEPVKKYTLVTGLEFEYKFTDLVKNATTLIKQARGS